MARILTLGSFDLLHSGHLELFETCRRIVGDDGTVIVSVNTSKFIEEYKGRPPVQTTEERVAMVRANRHVDQVFELDSQDAKPVIQLARPDFIIIGSDWCPPRDYHAQLMVTPEWLEERNIALLYQYRSGKYSTTSLKERVRDH